MHVFLSRPVGALFTLLLAPATPRPRLRALHTRRDQPRPSSPRRPIPLLNSSLTLLLSPQAALPHFRILTAHARCASAPAPSSRLGAHHRVVIL